MFNKRKCPKCGSSDVSRDFKNLAQNTAIETIGTTIELAIDTPLLLLKQAILPKGTFSYAAGAAAKSVGKKAHDAIVGDKAKYKLYRCNQCGKEWSESR